MLRAVSLRRLDGHESKKVKNGKSGKTSLAAITPNNVEKRSFCDRSHATYKCYTLKKKLVAARHEFAVKTRLCLICLNSVHVSSACSFLFACHTCSDKHNTNNINK